MLAHVYHAQEFIQDPAFNGFAAYLLPQSVNKISIYSKSGFNSRIYMYGWYTHTSTNTYKSTYTHTSTCVQRHTVHVSTYTPMCTSKHTSTYAFGIR